MDIQQIITALKAGMQQLPLTLFISILAFGIGNVLALMLAFIRYYQIPVLAPLARLFVVISRGLPVLLILLVNYLLFSELSIYLDQQFDLPFSLIDLNPAYIAIFSFSIMVTAQSAEAFRGALNAIDSGQLDAAKSIGLTRFQTSWRIILPQMIKIAIPQLGNIAISLVKATSLASLITVVDVLQGALITANQNYRYFESYLAASFIFWLLSVLIEQFTRWIEKKNQPSMEGVKT